MLGPTNTGKTHLAIERMLGHKSGLIGLPLRLLAREVYNKVVERVGAENVSLITGEERIDPPNSRFQICTVEAMPVQTNAEFVAIDEVQLATSFERGHIFTDRMLKLRGRFETMFLGASTVENLLRALLPGIHIDTRPRMSMLTYAGSKKITRLPARSAIVAFSAGEVYAIAELIRRQRGGAAVVMGSLSPRTRNAQVALYQSGEVDFLVATDAIGMGLNLDVEHVAFAQEKKFDGYQHRRLSAAEMAQIAGRAGRHTNDGTFGVTGNASPLEDELIEALETHQFQPHKVFMWRNSQLDLSTLAALEESLAAISNNPLLARAPPAPDIRALEFLVRDRNITRFCDGADQGPQVELLWEICRIPDYRKISPAAHGEILGRIFVDIAATGIINEDWFARQVAMTDRLEGDIDALSNRLSHIRTWTYVSNRFEWLENHKEWREKTRAIEDKLSDALHEALTKRFIDRRTSLLMKRLRENAMLEAEIGETGDVIVEGHNVGKLHGFRFSADTSASGPEAKAANAAAMKALAQEIERRAARLSACPNSDVVFSEDGCLRWMGQTVARVVGNESSALAPKLILLADEQLTGPALDKVQNRLERWLANYIENLLRPLIELSRDETVTGSARGLAFQIVENLGSIDRRQIAGEVKSLDQDARATLRRHGVRFGAFHVFLPLLLKPAPSALICLLWAVKNDKLDAPGLSEIPQISATGRTSVAVDPAFTAELYPLCGFRILGQKAVRLDILERLADLIRPALAWKEGDKNAKPDGAHDGRKFYVSASMLSILGATHEDMEQVLKGLGYKSQKVLESDVIAIADTKEVQQTVIPDEKPTEEKAVAGDKEKAEFLVETSESEEEPKYILLWQRDFKPKRNFASKSSSDGKQNEARKPRSGHQKPRRDGGSKFAGKKRPEKKPDPDSPFAKLAALKDAMNKK